MKFRTQNMEILDLKVNVSDKNFNILNFKKIKNPGTYVLCNKRNAFDKSLAHVFIRIKIIVYI